MARPCVPAAGWLAATNRMFMPGICPVAPVPCRVIFAPKNFAYQSAASVTLGTTIFISSVAIGVAIEGSSVSCTLTLSGAIRNACFAVTPGRGFIPAASHFVSDSFKFFTLNPINGRSLTRQRRRRRRGGSSAASRRSSILKHEIDAGKLDDLRHAQRGRFPAECQPELARAFDIHASQMFVAGRDADFVGWSHLCEQRTRCRQHNDNEN